MDTIRLRRATGGALLAATLFLSGCSSGGSDPSPPSSRPTAPTGSAPTGTAPAREATAALLKPLPTAVPAALRPYYDQKLTWRPCDTAPTFECATLKAPLDYAAPDAATDLKLAVSRKKATGPGARIGALMVNPGGPGSSAIDYLQQYAPEPAPVRARYDMVAMDPRGVGRSAPIACLPDREMDAYTQTDQTPDTPAEVTRLTAAYRDFARACRARSGARLGHVSTIEAARDMDVLRAVLGDRKLTYVGASYGTLLGATYAGLYPSRVGRLVLDGAMDPSLNARTINREQTAGFETAFTAFATDCAKRPDCPLGTGRPETVGKRLSAFFADLDRHPVATGTTRRLTESLATTGVIAAMYDENSWPLLREALARTQKGDGSGLLALADSYYERDPDGTYANQTAANPAVNCLDLPAAFSGPDEVRAALPSFRAASPVFGEGFAWSAANCASWPVKPTGTPHRIKAEGAAPILVVGTTRDPATPYRWAQGLASQLSSGTLLTYEGDGHTAYGRGSDCVDTAINTYLLEGTPPPAHKQCT
ncbi:alpha/beta hydrolase [Streptomyces sp. NPDC003077]|uniref:alpha/beta hydrolase n=1 Tax=Streptomyces sp. NPDC003077 TaxID=3154443 RepID=UPI0033A9AD82